MKINPVLDDHIKIDENNNIHVYLKTIDKQKHEIYFFIGKKNFIFKKKIMGIIIHFIKRNSYN